MDEALLRRLLGAAALLALAFLVATLLPEPRPGDRTGGTVIYDLRTGEQLGAGARSPVEHPPELKSEEKLEPRSAEPELASPAPPPPPRRPALKVDETLGQPGGWFVQVGSYASQANARNALQKLFGMGLPTVIQSVAVGQTLWYRVRVGPYPAESAALAALGRIKQNGYATARLVRPEADPARKGN
jgi:cell division septation protein DedD